MTQSYKEGTREEKEIFSLLNIRETSFGVIDDFFFSTKFLVFVFVFHLNVDSYPLKKIIVISQVFCLFGNCLIP